MMGERVPTAGLRIAAAFGGDVDIFETATDCGEANLARAKIARHIDDARGLAIKEDGHTGGEEFRHRMILQGRRFLFSMMPEDVEEREWWADAAGIDPDALVQKSRKMLGDTDPPERVFKGRQAGAGRRAQMQARSTITRCISRSFRHDGNRP